MKLGTRGSALALWQANWTKNALERRWPGLRVELVQVKTTGDKILDVPLAKIGGKGLFTKELDEALLDGRIDLAVHSLKDVPFQLPDGIDFGAIPEREDPRDTFVSKGLKLQELRPGARIGTSSLRRQVQLRHRFPSFNLLTLRGNVDTRLRKLDGGEFDGPVVEQQQRVGSEHSLLRRLDSTFLRVVALGIAEASFGDAVVELATRCLLRAQSAFCPAPRSLGHYEYQRGRCRIHDPC